MACGTGKTFTALRIAEKEINGSGLVLFLVPSIALLGQSLREWSADAKNPILPIGICFDPKTTRQYSNNDDSDFLSVVDLGLPASTDVKNIVRQLHSAKKEKTDGMTVVFSTYLLINQLK